MRSVMTALALLGCLVFVAAAGVQSTTGARPGHVGRACLRARVDQEPRSHGAIVAGRTPHLSWDNLPEVLADYASGRDAIVSRIDRLFEQLASQHQP